ncbi:OmpW/AlkL family protein [Novosphingobium cyanobacteriorum]|uniref:OmpW family outer membrane protein n=1 Tax=Novosphingobium cyanobacteriorum TaxID=3024215 RepID=A0ABT6CES2_9SPHN|nr:OmpW family outer membrane protein [Novosphingobium cyanobacteriorum]MDF8331575.1 OmpW family outer membrane protein [Novosphingobium cyanobacteriorum]
MKKILSAGLGAALAGTALLAPAAAHAGSADGKWQIKVVGTAVLPDGKIDKVEAINTTTTLGSTLAGITTAYDTKANDNYVPTIAVEYFFTPNVSVETICCLTQHHVDGTGALAGANIVNHVLILPATVTLKGHLPLGAIKPYVGVGPTVFFVLGEKPGSTATTLGIDKVKMSNSIGLALQGGVDIALGDKGFGLSLDAKKYFVKPTASFYDSGVLALKTKHDLSPWVLSAGVTYRF